MQKHSVQYITITSDFIGQRIDNFLITRLKGVPKTHIYRILRKGEIRVNKKRIKPSYHLAENDQVRLPPIRLAEKNILTPDRKLMTILSNRILYEDNALLIINKPSGWPVHGGSGVKLAIIETLRCMYPKSPHLELAHRLDADTSGCLILSKKRSVLKELHELLRSGKIRKIYWALTKGHWTPSQFRVEVPLHKSHLSSGERMVRVHRDGKPSLTKFNPLKSFNDVMLVEAVLETGRTHQIRVHAQYAGHPIAGDDKYGDKEFNKLMRKRGLRRLFLHAYSIEFILPSTKQHIKINAPLDMDLKKVLEVK